MFETLPGFREFYPEDCALRNHIFRLWRQTAVRYGFGEYDAPVLEPLDLYREKSGDEIVAQLFSFVDRGGREVALRPEMTPSLVRMAGAQANSLKRPVKWFSIGEQYRYERQQRGRLRAFYQFNADILGEAGPGAEIELIALLIQSLTGFGLDQQDFLVRVSDRDLWLLYLRGAGLDDDASAAVLQVIDKLGREPEEVSLEKLRPILGQGAADFWSRIRALRELRSLEDVVAFLSEETDEIDRDALDRRLAEWEHLLSGLKAMGLGDYIEVDLGVVRGLAYYTGFVFEAFDRKGTFRALAGGGRYDHLMKRLTKADLPAVGFAVGDVVLRELLDSKKLMPQYVSAPDLYVVAGDDKDARNEALADILLLRQAGYRVEYSLKGGGIGKQFKTAGQSGARYAITYGPDEVRDRKVKLKDLREGSEVSIPRAELLPRLAEQF